MGDYSSKIDRATLDLPISEARRIGTTASANFGWHLLSLLLPASLLRFRECPFRSRAQFTRLFLDTDFGFTIF